MHVFLLCDISVLFETMAIMGEKNKLKNEMIAILRLPFAKNLKSFRVYVRLPMETEELDFETTKKPYSLNCKSICASALVNVHFEKKKKQRSLS